MKGFDLGGDELEAIPDKGSQNGPRPESVTQFTQRIKQLLERGLGPCLVRGEVSNLRIQNSGHVYFSLKDVGAQISAVMFRGDASRLTMRLREGMQVLASGQLSVYEPRGQYQLVVRVLQEDGVGRLQREFEELKRRLAAEGLFDSARKRALPYLPERVGFVTSPTGAAVRDFMRILERRGWRGYAFVLPSKVQGEGAAEEIAACLHYAASLVVGAAGAPALRSTAEEPPFFDLLVVGRGGGSMEDLNAFNQEVLVRMVSVCPVPVISAVGHETDVTLCDFVADARAETPSGAAELVSSGFVAANERCERLSALMHKEMGLGVVQRSRSLSALASRLRLLAPAARIERGWLRLDDLEARLTRNLSRGLDQRRRDVRELSLHLARSSPEKQVKNAFARVLALSKRLESASPKSVLNRGFVILRDGDGKPIARAAELVGGAEVSAEFADAKLLLRVRE